MVFVHAPAAEAAVVIPETAASASIPVRMAKATFGNR
jgi:hypothetical protein